MNEIDEMKLLLKGVIEKFTVAPRWLSIKQARMYASMSENKLMEHIESDDIYATKKGGKWFVDKLSIDEFMMEDKAMIEKRFAEITGAHL